MNACNCLTTYCTVEIDYHTHTHFNAQLVYCMLHTYMFISVWLILSKSPNRRSSTFITLLSLAFIIWISIYKSWRMDLQLKCYEKELKAYLKSTAGLQGYLLAETVRIFHNILMEWKLFVTMNHCQQRFTLLQATA